MHLAYTMAPGWGDTDLLLHSVAQSIIQAGLQPAGTAQINTDRADAGPCDMDVLVLPRGPRIRISQSLGREAKGCRLDPDALESAVGLVQAALPTSDCLIINKFGKHEASGRGFRDVIAEAMNLDLPVVVGLNELNTEAFRNFSGDLAVRLNPDHGSILAWLTSRIGRRPDAA